MLGLLGLLGAMLAGIMGDSLVGPKSGASDDSDDTDTAPPAGEDTVSAVDGDFVSQIDEPDTATDPDLATDLDTTPDPEIIVPTEELPGEGPAAEPDPEAQLLVGTEDDEQLQGGAGNDGLLGGTGSDTLMGGDGHDALVGADDQDSDVLMGEAGNDSITLGAGDVATGGAGEDMFSLADFGPNTPPSVITDYSAADDHIVLMYDPEVHPEPVVTTAPIDGSDDMSVMLDGVQIAIVQGAPDLTTSDIQLMAA